MKKIDRTLRLRDGRGFEERAKVLHDTPCIFLACGKCSVYDVRPFACRALHSLDGRKCKKAVMAKRRVVAIRRDAQILSNPGADTLLQPNDELLVLGPPEKIAEATGLLHNPEEREMS